MNYQLRIVLQILGALVKAYEREVNPVKDWRDTALTEEEWLLATKEYREAKELWDLYNKGYET